VNVKKYIGIPYKTHGRNLKGVDCWGLIVLLYDAELNIKLPSFVEEYKSVKDDSLKDLVETEKNKWNKIDELNEYNVVLFRAEPYHIGLLIDDKGNMIHSAHGKDSCIENIFNTNWKNKIEGIFEYA